MPKDKVQKLEDTFFVWNALEAKSLERYEELVQYVNEHGNAWVPWSYKNYPALGIWVDTQRQLYKDRKLSNAECCRFRLGCEAHVLIVPMKRTYNCY